MRMSSCFFGTGLCFLLAFFSWGGLCVTQLGTVAGRASSLALWGVVTGLAAALLVVQVRLWFQLALI